MAAQIAPYKLVVLVQLCAVLIIRLRPVSCFPPFCFILYVMCENYANTQKSPERGTPDFRAAGSAFAILFVSIIRGGFLLCTDPGHREKADRRETDQNDRAGRWQTGTFSRSPSHASRGMERSGPSLPGTGTRRCGTPSSLGGNTYPTIN